MFGKNSVFRGDLFGGLTAAVIALPLAVAFGVSALAPLGQQYASLGALVGLLGAIYTGFFAALLGGTPVQVTGPTGPMTVVLTALLTNAVRGRPAEQYPVVLIMMALAIVVGGVAQVVLGAVGGGKVVKFIPYPVVAGFMNGIAVIIFLGQVKPFLGIVGAWNSFNLAQAWVPLAVGTMTIVGIALTKKFSKAIPSSLVGLAVGIATYLVIGFCGRAPLQATNNPLVVGPIPNPFASVAQIQEVIPLFKLRGLLSLSLDDWRSVFAAGITLGVLGSIDSLLTSVVADSVTRNRHDSRRELTGQGVGNIVSGLGGGLAGAGAPVRTLVNVNAGGSTRRSGMIHAVVVLVVVLMLGGPAGWIPLSALAGILFATAVSMVDYYSLRLIGKRRVRYEFAIMLVVTAVTVVVDLMVAVAIGVGIAAVLFILQQAKIGVVHRRLRGSEILSRRIRKESDTEVLRKHGGRTLAYELGGSLFFGTADSLLAEVEADSGTVDRLILDFSRVRDVDLSGVQILLSILRRLRDEGKSIALSGLANVERARPGVHKLLVDLGVLKAVGDDHVHATLDLALEAFEEEVLATQSKHRQSGLPLALLDYDAFSGLSSEEVELFATRISERSLEAGGVLFEENEPAEQLALVRSGRLSVLKKTQTGEVRLAALERGAIWGMRVLTGGERWNSTLRADSNANVFLLSKEAVEGLAREHPEVCEHLERQMLRNAMRRIDLLTSELVLLEEA